MAAPKAEAEQPARNLYQKIAGIMTDLEPIAKDGKVAFGTTKYNYVKAEVLFATLQKKLAAAGLVVIPMMEAVTASPGGDKVILAKMRFRLVNIDNPQEYIEAPWHAQAPATDDKAVNKAGTSGEKYWLMKLFLISDEEDPDADARPSEEHAAAKRGSPEMGIGEMRNAAKKMLETDTEAGSKLPKAIDDMNDAEAAKTYAWLMRRKQAAGATGK